MPSRNVEI